MKFIQYFTKEIYGYHEFKAKDKDEAEAMMDRFSTYANLDTELIIKDNGWQIGDLDEEVKRVTQ